MISVFETLNSIEQASSTLRSDEDNMVRIIEDASAELANLQTEQSTLFKSLAKVRLDILQQESVVGHLDSAERKALAALDGQKDKLSALAKEREQLASSLQAARAKRMTLSAKVAEAAGAISAVQEETESRMADDLEWQAQEARVTGAQARMQAAEEKAAQAEKDREEKSQPYLADKLFVYLWQRGYGTSAYSSGGLTRMGDDYVARVVNYEAARQNYFTLTEIPKRLREHADRLKAELEEEEAKLVALERTALEKDGIEAKEKAYSDAVADLKAEEDKIAELEAKDLAVEKERAALLSNDAGSELSKALTDLASSMQRQDLRDLLSDALDTPTTADERIVLQLQKIEKTMRSKQQGIDEARRTAMDIARKRTELERSANEFRRAGYDRMGGGFVNDRLIGDIIGGMIGGVLSSARPS